MKIKNADKDEELRKDLALVLVLLAVIILASFLSSRIDFEAIKRLIISFGILAPLVYMFFMFLAIVISPLPSVPLAVISGAIFGGFLGAIYSLLGAELGAITAFIIARKLGKPLVESRFRNIMKVYDSIKDKNIFTIILVSRMIPVFNFDLISYASGLTNIKLWEFAVATLIGMIPWAFIFSYSGTYFSIANVWLTMTVSILLVTLLYLVPKYIIKHRKKYNV